MKTIIKQILHKVVMWDLQLYRFWVIKTHTSNTKQKLSDFNSFQEIG